MPNPKAYPSILKNLVEKLVLVIIFGVMCDVAITWSLFRSSAVDAQDLRLKESAEIMSVVVQRLHMANDKGPLVQEDDELEEAYVWQLIEIPGGHVHSRSEQAPLRAFVSGPQGGPADSADGVWRVVTHGFNGEKNLLFALGQRKQYTDYKLASALGLSALASLVLWGAFALLVAQVVRRRLRPLNVLAERIQDYDPMVPESAPRNSSWAELQPMTESITKLGQRLSQRLVSERAFNAHAAHALRTPLAGLEAQLAVLQSMGTPEMKPWIVNARQTAKRLARVMHALLSMFRSGTEIRQVRFATTELVGLWTNERLSVELRGLPEIVGEPDLLAAALVNLLDNAYAQGATEVRLTTGIDHYGWLYLNVMDNGSGCDADTLARLRKALLQHDYSPETGLTGMGLMLADVVSVAHQGHVRIPEVAHGFCVEMKWPVSIDA